MTISEKRLRDSAFWEEESICLSCGAENDHHETECRECGSDKVINPALACTVLDNVEVNDV